MAWVVVAIVVIAVAVAVVSVAVVDTIFMIALSGNGGTAGRAKDTGMLAKECAIWSKTVSLGQLPGLKSLVLVLG